MKYYIIAGEASGDLHGSIHQRIEEGRSRDRGTLLGRRPDGGSRRVLVKTL